jgi:peptidoglycan hydrolase CwlO-like protein
MNTKKLISLLMMVVMVSGCATNAVLDGASEQVGPAEKSINLFNKEPSDKDLFDEALSLLNNQENKPKYDEAKIRLENMILQYPKSKWATGAQALILTLDRISALEAALKAEKNRAQGEHVKLTREIDGLKGDVKKAEEYTAETTRLQQENDQLRKDIEQLKNLEIRLEKREKMLR